MIAELKNSKNSTMQEDAGDIDAATIPSAIIIKDERLSNPSTIGCASASGSASVAATNVTHLESHHVGVKNESESACGTSEPTQTNYKRKLMFSLGHDDNGGGYCGPGTSSGIVGMLSKDNMEVTDGTQQVCKKPKLCTKKDQMFELFQPWALKTYGDQAKTKTITLRKKARILKALEGKEHSRPDSSKFRFWVKSKAFTTKKPECFQNIPDYPSSSNTEYPNNVDLYVASTTKDFGQRTYRKVAVVEEFFNIIYNIHVEMGGRSGRHAGQKRTYRIITETFAFLPREAVTRFLSACPECKKNLRPLSPGRPIAEEDIPNESSTEIDVLNYSSQTETSMEIPKTSTAIEKTEPIEHRGKSHNPSPHVPKEDVGSIIESSSVNYPSLFQKIRINPILQTQSFDTEAIRSAALGASAGSVFGSQMNFGMLNRESLVRYYDFMRRLYGQSASIPITTQEETPKPELEPEPEPEPKPEPEPELEPVPEPEPAPEIKHTAHKFQPEAIDLTIEDQSEDQGTASSISTPIAMHSESIQESSQQICAINLSKTISRYSMIPKVKQKRRPQQQSHHIQSVGFEMSGTPATSGMTDIPGTPGISGTPIDVHEQELPQQLDLRKVKPITSTYLQLTRSMGLTDADALKLDDLEPPIPTPPIPDTASDTNPEDPYAGLMKDADKLKLMLLAWNYQNSNAVRNGTEGPDLGVVGGLWAQYQNALAQNVNKMETSISPVPRAEESSPMENQDETNSSGQKEEDEGSEDDSDDKLDQQAHDPERLKAFNMFVRLFVDENLDRIIPISKQPKEKIQAIIDSCARQFPEFSERSRKRIRTYLKSCRRNKKAREGWDNTTRPTPAHLTSVQAEQILAIACENESLNAKRMRIGLDPITQAVPLTTSTSSTSTVATSEAAATSTPFTSGFRSTPNPSISESDVLAPTTTSTQGASSSARSSPLALSTTSVGQPLCGSGGSGTTLSNGNTTVTSVGAIPASSPLYRPTDFTSPTSTSPYAARTPTYPSYFPASNATPTDLSMKAASAQQPTQSITSTAAATSSSLSPNVRPPPPLVTHKLSANEITAARQVITAYRESAAFLLRTADQVEQLLVQQQ